MVSASEMLRPYSAFDVVAMAASAGGLAAVARICASRLDGRHAPINFLTPDTTGER
jgi:hypothetical protein